MNAKQSSELDELLYLLNDDDAQFLTHPKLFKMIFILSCNSRLDDAVPITRVLKMYRLQGL